MTSDLILVAIVGVPVALLLVTRSHAAIVFFSLCAGSVLVSYFGQDATNIVASVSTTDPTTTDAVTKIAVMLVPVVLSAVLLRKSVHGIKLIFNLVPTVAVGLMIALLTVPLLPGGVRHNLTSTTSWSILSQFDVLIVVVGVLSSLAVLWLAQLKGSRAKHH